MDENWKKKKIAKRIVTYCEIYNNDFDQLMRLELMQLKKLELNLFIGLRIKFEYKKRHNQ